MGLEKILRRGGVIYAAHPDEPWPSSAAVIVSRVHIHKGGWQGPYGLSDKNAPTISAFLTPREEWTPQRLKANEGIAFQGSIVLGMGFVIAEELALEWIARDAKYRDVLFPYLNGEDLNSHPEQKPSRWVVNFWDWPEERVREYPLAFERVERLVKPQRMKVKRKVRRERWWQHAECASGLYHAIGRGHRFIRHPEGWDPDSGPTPSVLVRTQVSRTWAFAHISNVFLFDQRLVVISFSEFNALLQAQSSIHLAWSTVHSSKLKLDTTYTPTTVFETYPFPRLDPETDTRLEDLGERYHELRAEIMRDQWIGLTRLYNRFHDPTETGRRLARLRESQVEIDRAVAAAYGWTDLALAHDFHRVAYLPENDNLRFTVSEDARIEILHRLALLNRQRYQEEVDQGLHEKKKKPAKRAARKPRKTDSTKPKDAPPPEPVATQPTLFGEDEPDRPYTVVGDLLRVAEPDEPGDSAKTKAVDPAEAVTAYLQQNPGWHRLARMTKALDLPGTEILRALNALVAQGNIHYRTGALGRGEYRGK